MPAFDVLTLNAHMGFALFRRRYVLPALRDALRSVSAEVVFLQEVLGEHALHAQRLHGWQPGPQYEFLADGAWPGHAYGRNADYPHGHHGNALLSAFPILRSANRDASIAGHEPRGILHCVLALPDGGELHACCVHLGLRESHRQHQLLRLIEFIETDIPAQAPLIVAGDFNDWRQRGHAVLARHSLHEAFVHAHGAPAASFPVFWPRLPLDRVYVRHAEVRAARVLGPRPWNRLSDHLPLLVRLEV